MPIIHLYTFCYNESFLVPFFLQHYAPLVEKIVVYDNESTDDSIQLLLKEPKVEVRKWETNNEQRDDIKTQMMDNIWKESRGLADWVIVCDFDEFLYHPSWETFMQFLAREKVTVCRPLGFDMVGEALPDPALPITQQIRKGVRLPTWDKMILFDPNRVTDINFSVGGHSSIPEGSIKAYFKQDQLRLLHYRYLSLDHILDKHKLRAKRLSQVNRQRGWGRQYLWPEARQIEIYHGLLQRRIMVI